MRLAFEEDDNKGFGDLYSSNDIIQSTQYRSQVHGHIKWMLENQYMTTEKYFHSTEVAPLEPDIRNEAWLGKLRRSKPSDMLKGSVKALPKDAKSPLTALPNELLEMVVKCCEPSAQVMLRNTCKEMRQKVPRPIVIRVLKMMGLWEVVYATMMV